ncbi:hypothetical protein AB0D34_31890 [Streptomyces sp. NPDC048420]|uniref:hypothetical protein n=1 Tax=Streptomyces sp. NPDC048420 TaxID=3155755 RepID=UPI00342A033F
MAIPRSSQTAHPLFQGVFSDWQAKAGVLSALPDAPVVADETRAGPPVWQWLRFRPGRGGGRALEPLPPPLKPLKPLTPSR